jgi:hypothetical protein
MNFTRVGIAEEAMKSQEFERSPSPLPQPMDVSAYHGHDVARQSGCNKSMISAGGSTPPPANNFEKQPNPNAVWKLKKEICLNS